VPAKLIDGTVGEHQPAPLAFADHGVHGRMQYARSFCGIVDLTRPLQDIPSDLKRVFDKNGKWFTHRQKTAMEPVSSYLSHSLCLNCRFGGLSRGAAIQSDM
jgi:hypothetical protein